MTAPVRIGERGPVSSRVTLCILFIRNSRSGTLCYYSHNLV